MEEDIVGRRLSEKILFFLPLPLKFCFLNKLNLLLSGVHVSETAASLVSHSVVCSAPGMQVSESGRRVL